MQEIRVGSLGGEDPLEEEMATHSSILEKNLVNRGAWWVTDHRVTKESDMTEQLSKRESTFKY